jgi:nucleoid-associated protein YgaU
VGPGEAGSQLPQPGAEPEPQPEVVAPPAPEDPPPSPSAAGAATKVVTLKRGQTLIHLAKEHLGSGNRFRELLELNGWSDEDARRLAEGTKVRVPVEAGRAPAKPKAGSGTPRNGR